MEVPGKRTDTDDEAENVASLDKLCQPCKVDNVNTPANGFCKECEGYMCTACFRQHLRLTLCRHHTLLDINAFSEACLKRHSRATKCKQHDGDPVKYYCRKHEAVGCGDCMVSNHNKCESEFLKNFSENFQQHEDYRTFMKQLDQLISERKEFEKKVQENKGNNKVMLEKALSDIKQFRFDINKYLDKVETDITCQVKKVMEENQTLLNELENDCSMLSTKLEELTNMLNSELYKDNVLFIHTIECKPKFSESEKKMSNMKSKSMKQYEFVCDQQLRSLVTSVQTLGTLAVKSSAVFFPTIEDVNKKGTKFCLDLGNTPTETMKMMTAANQSSNVSRSLVLKYHKRLSEGRESLKDDTERGRKRIDNAGTVAEVKSLIEKDCRLNVSDIWTKEGISYGSVHSILRNQLKMTKVHARWVPRLLKNVEKERRVQDFLSFLRQYERHGDAFLDKIITTDETWLWFYDPETKQQSFVWKRNSSPTPTEGQGQSVRGEYMFIMFMDRRDMLLCNSVRKDQTVNADYYSKVLRCDLMHALWKKRPGIPIEIYILHQDNAPPLAHRADTIRLELDLMRLKTIDHIPYSPDLAPIDFAVFPTIKAKLKGQKSVFSVEASALKSADMQLKKSTS